MTVNMIIHPWTANSNECDGIVEDGEMIKLLMVTMMILFNDDQR